MKTRINGIDLAYSDLGQGQPVVFLHAFPLNRRMWEPQVQGLSDQYRTITIDLRGHGESDAPLWRYTLEQFADDIQGLMNHLSIAKATFVGLSMGGYILFALFRKYPRLIRALVLADTRSQADTEDGKAARFSMAQTAYQIGQQAIADAMIPKLLGPASVRNRNDLVQQLRTMITGNQISGIVGDLMAMEERPDSTPLLNRVACPTLVIVGEDDIATPLADAKVMASHIPHARFEVIPNAGHVSNMENPDAFNRALKTFLSSLG